MNRRASDALTKDEGQPTSGDGRQEALPDVPADLSDVSWSTRILIYRDACMLASADGSVSSAEEIHLADLASRMALPSGVTESVQAWVRDYGHLLERLDDLLSRRRADGEI